MARAIGPDSRKLDQPADLGTDGVRISPFDHAPMVDIGYHITDHIGFSPTFGTPDTPPPHPPVVPGALSR